MLEICVLPKVNWFTLMRASPDLLLRGRLPSSATILFKARTLTLTSSNGAPLQVDGEFIGHLPATFSVLPQALRVIAPPKPERGP
jgi:diacylglycerol kinase family enzyme